METQDIAIYGGLAYLIYRLTRPAEEPVAAGPGGPEYVPVVHRPPSPDVQPAILTVVGSGPAAPPQQTLFQPAPPPAPPTTPSYESVAVGAPRSEFTPTGTPTGVFYDLVVPGTGPAAAVLPTGQVAPYVAPAGSIVGQPANQTLWQVQPSGALFQAYAVPGGGFMTGYANAIAAGWTPPAG